MKEVEEREGCSVGKAHNQRTTNQLNNIKSASLQIIASLKGTVHPKMTILSPFTQPHVILNPYDFTSGIQMEMF